MLIFVEVFLFVRPIQITLPIGIQVKHTEHLNIIYNRRLWKIKKVYINLKEQILTLNELNQNCILYYTSLNVIHCI